MVSFVIVCAGSSTRFGGSKNKLLFDLNGKPVFKWSVDLFSKYSDDVIVVTNEELFDIVKGNGYTTILGGKTRQESVSNGVKKAKYENVLIHDGARPNLSEEDLNNLINALEEHPFSYLGGLVTDTIRDKKTSDVIDREKLIRAYTPQAVLKSKYLIAYEKALEENYVATDDIALVKKYITDDINLVIGSNKNIKITTQEDLVSLQKPDILIGHSWDIHRLVSGRPLYLGGALIPFDKGLLGHSDGDCVLHAIAEALLGCLALGDLGKIYPDNDPNTEGIDSKIILKYCYDLILKEGYRIKNLDVMVYAELPKMKPHILTIRQSIADVLDLDVSKVSVKATTYEKLGEIGQGLAIASDATVLIEK